MRFWDVSGPEVEAADAEPWDGPLASTMRPFSTRGLVRLAVAGAVLYLVEPGVALAAIALNPTLGEHRTVGVALGCFGLLVGVAAFVGLLLLSPHQIRRAAPAVTTVTLMATPIVASIAMASVGPQFAVWATVYIGGPMFAFYVLRLRWALVCASLVLIGFGLIVAFEDGWRTPIASGARSRRSCSRPHC
jgi:hypothetical protein